MQIEFSYEEEFDELMRYLFDKYPNELKEMEGLGSDLDLNQFAEQFFGEDDPTSDVSVDANANVSDKSVITYAVESKKPFERLNSYYMLWKELNNTFNLDLANELVERQFRGDIYIHDFHGIGTAKSYCFNYSTYDIATKGLSMVNKVDAKPPKHLYAFKSQVEQFTVVAANSTLGATGLADFLVVMAGYVDKILETMEDAHFEFNSEKDIWKYVRETLVSWIYTVNQPMRADQSPFTNVSIYDDYFLDEMLDDYPHPVTGETPNKETVKKMQEIFLDAFNKEHDRTPLTFPVVTACFSVDEKNQIKDDNFLSMISEKNLEYGFINIYIGESSTLSSCCRLRSESDNEYFNSFGAGSTKIGSIGVVTINLPRVAKLHQEGIVDFYSEMRKLVEYCNKINYAKRKVIKDKIDRGNHPLYSLGFLELDKQYSTVGINGFNEAIEIMGEDILEEEGEQLGLDIIEFINEENEKWQDEFNNPTNTEQVPAEASAAKLAKKDQILGIQSEYDLYSNQFVPLTTEADLLDRIRLQGTFDEHFSGGSIGHWNVEEKIEDKSKMKDLIKASAEEGVKYFAVNYNIQECEGGHMTVGKKDKCPKCEGEITDNYTRVVGFLTNVSDWHETRREIDYPNRVFEEDLFD